MFVIDHFDVDYLCKCSSIDGSLYSNILKKSNLICASILTSFADHLESQVNYLFFYSIYML